MNDLLRVTGSINAALTSLAVDQPEVQGLLDKMPQVVVIGSQSAGKSSLLEAFFNQRILPRGRGTVTKRPTIISLVTQRDLRAPVVTFQDPRHEDVPRDVGIMDEGTVLSYLEKENDVFNPERGPSGQSLSGVSSLPIRLTIAGPDLPTLTMVDLPGMIIDKPQFPKLEQEIRELVFKYITDKPNMLMLAVVDGTIDIEMQHAKQAAERADRFGQRTILVYTHMDTAKDTAWKALQQAAASASPTSIGVKLRLEHEAKIPLPEAMWNEREWFANNKPPGAGELPNVGVHYLLWKVQDWLIPQINHNLADITEDIRVRLAEADLRARRLAPCTELTEPYQVVREIDSLCVAVDTAFFKLSKHTGGSRYKDVVMQYQDADMTAGLDQLLQFDNVVSVISNAQGVDDPIDPSGWSEKGCKALAKVAVNCFLPPAEKCLDQIEALLVEAATEAINSNVDVQRYVALKQKMIEAVVVAIRGRKAQAIQDVKTLLAKHKRLLNGNAIGKMFEEEQVCQQQVENQTDAVQANSFIASQTSQAFPGAEITAIRRAKVEKNVRLTTHLVRRYIKESVKGHLAYDIPASWRLFMLHGHPYAGLLKKVLQEGETGDGSDPDCLAQQCHRMVPSQALSHTRHAIATAAELQALVKESDEIELERRQLNSQVSTLKQSLEMLQTASAASLRGPYEPMDKPASLKAPEAPPAPKITPEDMQAAVTDALTAAQARFNDEQAQRQQISQETADTFASEVTALKEQVQAVEMAKQVQQANMDRDRAIEVAQLKAQVQQAERDREQREAAMQREKEQQEAAMQRAQEQQEAAMQRAQEQQEAAMQRAQEQQEAAMQREKADREKAELQQRNQALLDRQKAQEDLQARELQLQRDQKAIEVAQNQELDRLQAEKAAIKHEHDKALAAMKEKQEDSERALMESDKKQKDEILQLHRLMAENAGCTGVIARLLPKKKAATEAVAVRQSPPDPIVRVSATSRSLAGKVPILFRSGMEDEDSDRSTQIASFSGNRAAGVSIKHRHEKLPHLPNAPTPPAAAPSATADAV